MAEDEKSLDELACEAAAKEVVRSIAAMGEEEMAEETCRLVVAMGREEIAEAMLSTDPVVSKLSLQALPFIAACAEVMRCYYGARIAVETDDRLRDVPNPVVEQVEVAYVDTMRRMTREVDVMLLSALREVMSLDESLPEVGKGE